MMSVIDLLVTHAGEQRVLEIGCGWGELAGRLIEQTGCHVTGLTLSKQQLAYAQHELVQQEYAS